MSRILLPNTWSNQPQYTVGADRSQAANFRTIWLATFNSAGNIRDVVGEQNLILPGGQSNSYEGRIATFSGAQQQNRALILPSTKPDTYVIAARIRATAAQAGNPGAAFGIYAGAGQSGIGVGFDGTYNVGATWLTDSGAGIGAYKAGAQNTWYTVFAQMSTSSINSAYTKAWINGQPATTNQGSATGGACTGINELSIGAQHRSSGYLRNFTGDILWAAILRYEGAESATAWSMTDSSAALLYSSNYPWQVFKPQPRKIWVAVTASGATVSATLGTASASGFVGTVSSPISIAASLGTASAAGYSASVVTDVTVIASLGTTNASGYAATVDSAGAVSVICSIGTTAASGYTATVSSPITIQATLGNAAAVGYTAVIDALGAVNIQGAFGTATASGFAATVANASFTASQLAEILAYIQENLMVPTAEQNAAAVWQSVTGMQMETRLAEAWGRLGLDPSKPLVTGQTSITFGDIAMAMTGDSTSTTVTRQ